MDSQLVSLSQFIFILSIGSGIVLFLMALATAKRQTPQNLPLNKLAVPLDSSFSQIVNITGNINEAKLEFENSSGHNPIYMWGKLPVEIGDRIENIPFPIFRWWALFEEGNEELRRSLAKQFLANYRDKLRDSRIYAGTVYSYDFLKGLDNELQQIGAEVFINPPPPPPHPPNSTKIIFFDISISTGQTTRVGVDRLPDDQKPNYFIFLFLNDTVAPNYNLAPFLDENGETNVSSLFKYSDVIPYWIDNNEYVLPLLTVRKALYGQLEWDDPSVNIALNNLRQALY